MCCHIVQMKNDKPHKDMRRTNCWWNLAKCHREEAERILCFVSKSHAFLDSGAKGQIAFGQNSTHCLIGEGRTWDRFQTIKMDTIQDGKNKEADDADSPGDANHQKEEEDITGKKRDKPRNPVLWEEGTDASKHILQWQKVQTWTRRFIGCSGV